MKRSEYWPLASTRAVLRFSACALNAVWSRTRPVLSGGSTMFCGRSRGSGRTDVNTTKHQMVLLLSDWFMNGSWALGVVPQFSGLGVDLGSSRLVVLNEWGEVPWNPPITSPTHSSPPKTPPPEHATTYRNHHRPPPHNPRDPPGNPPGDPPGDPPGIPRGIPLVKCNVFKWSAWVFAE